MKKRANLQHIRKLFDRLYFSDQKVFCFASCGKVVVRGTYEAGHINPDVAGGNSTAANIVPMCRSCNRHISGRHAEDVCKVMQPKVKVEGFCVVPDMPFLDESDETAMIARANGLKSRDIGKAQLAITMLRKCEWPPKEYYKMHTELSESEKQKIIIQYWNTKITYAGLIAGFVWLFPSFSLAAALAYSLHRTRAVGFWGAINDVKEIAKWMTKPEDASLRSFQGKN